jgi:predicted Fe-Mo cluster-binding NifX family protein
LKSWRKRSKLLKVAVSAIGGTLDSAVSPRFGRCPYYVIVDTETMSFEAFSNTSIGAPSGAGIGAAQLIAEKGVEAVLTGAMGPNAMAVLSQVGIKMVTGAQGSVRQAVEAFKGGSLKPELVVGYRPRSFYGGSGAGLGLGRGRRMGRGMGVGRGMSLYTYQPQPQADIQPLSTPLTKEQEIKALTLQLQQLERQLREIEKRLKEFR